MGNTCMIPSSTTCINSTKMRVLSLIDPGKIGNALRKRMANKKRKNSIVPLRPISNDLPISINTRNLITTLDKELIELCWRKHIVTERRDLFHKTMLFSIEASPVMNEIIACDRYCYRDLTKWPKLNRICQAQFNFFEKLIYDYKLEETEMYAACAKLGEMHANYAQFGLKPHFMDIFQQKLLGLIAGLEMEPKVETCIAFTHLTSFVIDVMIAAYQKKVSNIRSTDQLSNQ